MLATDGTKINTSAIMTKITVNKSRRPERPAVSPVIPGPGSLSSPFKLSTPFENNRASPVSAVGFLERLIQMRIQS